MICAQSTPTGTLSPQDINANLCRFAEEMPQHGQRILLVVPDLTRTAPIDVVYQTIYPILARRFRDVDVMVALGTHQPLTDQQICQRLGISEQQHKDTYTQSRFFNHAFDDPEQLQLIGHFSSEQVWEISEGLMREEVPITINKRLLGYDQVLIIGPVFPHEVVGFSGGNKYLFPGVAGRELIDFFHWLGALITNVKVIGVKHNPVRRVVDEAAKYLSTPRYALCLVEDSGLAGMFGGSPEEAWQGASELSSQRHILYTPRAYHTILSCAPEMYDEMWVGGKCMYKLEPVLAEGGTLIIYAPHIKLISVTHGALIEEVGYHCRDYIVYHWERLKHIPRGVLAHSTHVKGQGRMEGDVEHPRARVVLATGISEELTRKVNLDYVSPGSINPADYANREAEGVLLVPHAGERLYRLRE